MVTHIHTCKQNRLGRASGHKIHVAQLLCRWVSRRYYALSRVAAAQEASRCAKVRLKWSRSVHTAYGPVAYLPIESCERRFLAVPTSWCCPPSNTQHILQLTFIVVLRSGMQGLSERPLMLSLEVCKAKYIIKCDTPWLLERPTLMDNSYHTQVKPHPQSDLVRCSVGRK